MLIEMVVGHHKSVKKDAGEKGLLDLEEGYDYELSFGYWEEWSPKALTLLDEFGMKCTPISEDEALGNLEFVVNFCQKKVRERGFSSWRGLLMGADHFASAVIHDTEKHLNKYISETKFILL